jgi:hypothetical protein
MKRPIHLIAFVAAFSLLFTACKKESSDIDTDETEFTVQSDDQASFSQETDEVADEINGAIESSPALQGKGTGTQSLCNATVVIDSVSNPRSVTITYNGLNCAGTRTRTGMVKTTIPAGVRWKDAGAVLTVTITNLKITRVSDGKYITINGTQQITNVSGGRLSDLPTMGTIIHTIGSNNMNIKFDTSNAQRTWNVARKRTFTFNAGNVNITTTGNHTIGANTKVAEWGTNRFGNTFITSIEEPLTVRSSCNFRLTNGRVRHELLGRNLTATFGLDAQGNPTTCPGANPYYMKLVWTGPGGQTHTVIRPY